MFPTLRGVITHQRGSPASSLAFNLPAGVQAGDVLVALLAWNGTATVNTVAGWTFLATGSNISNHKYRPLWRRAQAGDTSVTVTFSAAVTASMSIYAWQDAWHTTPAVESAAVSTVTTAATSSGAVAMPTPTWGSQDVAWMVAAAWDPLAGVGDITSPSWNEEIHVGDSVDHRQKTGWLLSAAATVAGPTYTNSPAVRWATFGLAVRGAENRVAASFTWAADPSDRNRIIFTSTATGPIVAPRLWDFGDGTTGTGITNNHTFAGPGTYDVIHTVNGSDPSNTSSITVPVDVAPPPAPPALFVSIAGEDVTCDLISGDWQTGRSDWYSRLEPSTASFELLGDISALTGDALVIGSQYGTLWTGEVEGVRTTKDTDGIFRSVVTGRDKLARLGAAELGGASPPAGNILTKMAWLFAFDGQTATVTTGPAQGTLPAMDAEPALDINALQALQDWEDNSNAAVFLMPNGSWVVQHRSALPVGTTLAPVPLVGPDCPWEWVRVRSTDLVINDWKVKRSSGTVVMSWEGAASIAKYGRHTFPIDRALHALWPTAPTPGQSVAAAPRWVVEAGRFEVRSYDQKCYTLRPLDFVELEGELWQILAVRHEVGIGSWSMTVTADQSQNSMGGIPDPPVDPTAGVTVSGRADKDAQVVLNPSGVELGAGKGAQTAVGYYQGYKHRTLLGWKDTLAFPAYTVGIVKATLELETSNQTQVAFGSSPKIIVRAVTSNWPDEGTYATNDYRNAVVWPGPNSSAAGNVSKAVTRTERVKVTVDVTDIVASMLNNEERTLARGVVLHSANENSPTPTTEFLSRDAGGGLSGALLTIKCTVEPPARASRPATPREEEQT